MFGTFEGCNNLKVVPELNTSKVTNMASIFYGCTSLTEQPNLDYSKVTNFLNAFYDTNIQTFNLTFDGCKNLSRSFQNASGITEITIHNSGTNLVDLSYCFSGATVSNITLS